MSRALDLAKRRSTRTHQLILKVAGDLDDARIAWRPGPRAHSIGWTLWHIARCADRFAAEVRETARPARDIWLGEGLAEKWRLDAAVLGTNGVGTGVDDEVAARVAPPKKDELLDYARRAFAALDALVASWSDDDLSREFDSFFTEGPTTIGEALFTCLSHENRHLGELEYIKGLQGVRGSATR